MDDTNISVFAAGFAVKWEEKTFTEQIWRFLYLTNKEKSNFIC
jgi:hypothetical protein